MEKPGEKKNNKAKGPGVLELSREQIADRLRREMGEAGGNVKKFITMMESFRGEIPEEAKRISATLKAMGQAAGIEKDDILASAEQQRANLKKQQKLFMQALDEKRDEMKSSANRAKELKSKIEELKDQVLEFQDDYEQAKSEATNGEDMIMKAEKRMSEAVKMLDDEVVTFKKKIEGYDKKTKIPEPSGDKMNALTNSLNFDISDDGDDNDEGDGDKEQSSDEKKPCPRCGGELAWYEIYEKWGCYSCGYQAES